MRNNFFFPFLFSLFLILSLLSMAPYAATAEGTENKTISLPAPQKNGGKPLMEALAERHTNRDFDESATIAMQEISNLLWATWGTNRSDGRRTAPTAKNRQELEVYVAMAKGLWRYDATANTLVLVLNQDVREKLGGAPLTLLYAAPEEDPLGTMHIGALYQNAGLYCASTGLANVVKGTGADALDDLLSLPKGYKIYLIQAIGWPKKSE